MSVRSRSIHPFTNGFLETQGSVSWASNNVYSSVSGGACYTFAIQLDDGVSDMYTVVSVYYRRQSAIVYPWEHTHTELLT